LLKINLAFLLRKIGALIKYQSKKDGDENAPGANGDENAHLGKILIFCKILDLEITHLEKNLINILVKNLTL
jgi:hypothetical protein